MYLCRVQSVSESPTKKNIHHAFMRCEFRKPHPSLFVQHITYYRHAIPSMANGTFTQIRLPSHIVVAVWPVCSTPCSRCMRDTYRTASSAHITKSLIAPLIRTATVVSSECQRLLHRAIVSTLAHYPPVGRRCITIYRTNASARP